MPIFCWLQAYNDVLELLSSFPFKKEWQMLLLMVVMLEENKEKLFTALEKQINYELFWISFEFEYSDSLDVKYPVYYDTLFDLMPNTSNQTVLHSTFGLTILYGHCIF